MGKGICFVYSCVSFFMFFMLWAWDIMTLCVFMFCVYVLVFFDFITFFVVFVSFLFYVLWHFLFWGILCMFCAQQIHIDALFCYCYHMFMCIVLVFYFSFPLVFVDHKWATSHFDNLYTKKK